MGHFLGYIEDPVTLRLAGTLMELSAKMSLDSITTTMLLERSGVGKSTFYRRFRNKYDLLNQCYDIMVHRTMGKISTLYSYTEGFVRLTEAMKEDAAFFRNAFSSQEPDSLRYHIIRKAYNSFRQMMIANGCDVSSPPLQMKLQGYVTGAMEITSTWLEMKNVSAETLVSVYYQLMPGELQTCLFMRYM